MADETKIDAAVELCVFGKSDLLFEALVNVVQHWKENFKNLKDEDEEAFLGALCEKVTDTCKLLYWSQNNESESKTLFDMSDLSDESSSDDDNDDDNDEGDNGGDNYLDMSDSDDNYATNNP